MDYSRTEKVQFEDDEYYYYVKAVPKMTVAAPAKTVKRINAQRYRGGERSVTMEQTSERVKGRTGGSSGARRTRGDYTGGKSVTVGNTDLDSEDIENDDYEELF